MLLIWLFLETRAYESWLFTILLIYEKQHIQTTPQNLCSKVIECFGQEVLLKCGTVERSQPR